jgi:hypothetical protein
MVSAKWSNAKPTEMVIIATADNRFKIKSLLLVKP